MEFDSRPARDAARSAQWKSADVALPLDEPTTSSALAPLHRPARRPSFVLTMGDYHGTIAAARDLGRAGIECVLADASFLARAGWSRWVRRRVRCAAPADDPAAFVDRIEALGRSGPGSVLYPASDDTAFLFALHAARLGAHYRLFQPTVETIYALLNKKRLFDLCARVGLDAPATWFPADRADVDRITAEARGPVILKPQTQIQYRSQIKGFRVPRSEDLGPMYEAFLRESAWGHEIATYDPGVVQPMIQRFHAVDRIYSIAGFRTPEGRIVARASNKVFQRPRRMGVGICFEAAPVDAVLLEKLARLCEEVGYFGVFETEFIESEGRALLIDFNPRFYGQMHFEVSRGLPLARLVFESACGNDADVSRLLDRAAAADEGPVAYCHRNVVRMSLALTRLFGAGGADHDRRLRTWYAAHGPGAADPMFARDDPGPWLADLVNEGWSALRHPRSFFRSLARE